MSKIVLYGFEMSPAVRACLLTLNALDKPFEFKIVNLAAGEHMTPEFLSHNPQHTIPVLDDNGTWLWDSHAINGYLVQKYGKSDTLYPKELVQRARVDQRLHFDSSVLVNALSSVTRAICLHNVTVMPKEDTDLVIAAYDFVETFLGNNHFITGDTLTIADFSCVATITSLSGIVPIDAEKYPKLSAWIKRLSALPYYEKSNGKGATEFINFFRAKLTVDL